METATEAEFWKIVEASRGSAVCRPEVQSEVIAEALRGSTKERLVAFAGKHFDILDKLYTWPLLKACYVVLGSTSYDIFEDFRNWIVLNGESRFYQTLKDPQAIADYAVVQDPLEEINGEPLLYVYGDAWAGDIEALESIYRFPKAELNDSFGRELPSKELLAIAFPKLAERFNFGTTDFRRQ